MFDVGFFELCLIGVVALLVIGPDKLPRAARTAGLWLGRAKRMVAKVKSDIDAEIRQEDLMKLKEMGELKEAKNAFTGIKEQMTSVTKDLNAPVIEEKKEEGKSGDAKPDSGGEPAKS